MKADRDKPNAGYLFPELLSMIFSFAFDNGFATLPRARAKSCQLSLRDKTSCSTVCKSWRDVAVPMLYDYVVFCHDSQLSRFLATLNHQSGTFNYRRMVKGLTVDLQYPSSDACYYTIEDILSLCPNLTELVYERWHSVLSGVKMVALLKRLDRSLLICLSLGRFIELSPGLLPFLQELPQLQVLSLHFGYPLHKHGSIRLPHVTTLSLFLISSAVPGYVLSTPSLTRLSITFAGSHSTSEDLRSDIHKITADIGQSLRFLGIDWEDGNGIPGAFDLNMLGPCQQLHHLVIRGVSSFVGTHANLRFIDVWRELRPTSDWPKAEKLDLDENQLQVELPRAHLPSIARVRVLDDSLRPDIPELPTILPPTRRENESLRLHVFNRIVWDTPTMVFDEQQFGKWGRELSPPHVVDEFVSNAYKYMDVLDSDLEMGPGLGDLDGGWV
ncbi:hypothetical protein OE88DRAFT_1213774 [Heliocybe sulcata]|uniref:Uncharacterized protein n=1 Tax=Heliocybe sulcata TaxID=5364 RepID=A0A5C3MLF9_9AGAM|nr:hypothetical protein OE88DRAFT_1213774 [Heliocybe sulcata]